MKYNRFEELPVWQDAIELAVRIFALTSTAGFRNQFTLKDQIERAGVSIPNNIAEGFERGTINETLTFLYISRGSSGEVRSLTYLLERFPRFSRLTTDILDIRSRATSVSRQLGAWSGTLQASNIKGQRYLVKPSSKGSEI